MQLSSLPTKVIAANRDVLGSLQQAAASTRTAQQGVEHDGRVPAGTKQLLSTALVAAQDAVAGVEQLGAANVLDGTFQRYAGHSVRHLQDAVAMLERGGRLGADATSIFSKHVFDAEVATRLGVAAGERSVANPSARAIERATEHAGAAAGAAASGPTWVDGAWIDELGNPARGSGEGWAGPDGERFGDDGGPVGDGGGYVGPDGEGYSGI